MISYIQAQMVPFPAMVAIACLGLKGGSGKTTLAVNLAAELGAARVLDMDPQGHAGTWARLARKPEEPVQGFDVGRDVLQVSAPTPRALEAELARYGRQLVILDLPPALPEAADVAVMAVDLAVIPCGPSPLDLAAARAAVSLCQDARKIRKDHGRPLVLLVPNRLQRGTVLGRETPAVLEELGEPVSAPICSRVAFVEAVVAGKTIGDYAPDSEAHHEIAALAKRIQELLGTIS